MPLKLKYGGSVPKMLMSNVYFSPVFLIGCGRSGTSYLGSILSKHHQVVYLDEPREIWSAGYPETDIWSRRASANKGRLFMNQNDEVPEKSNIIRHLFLSEIKKKKNINTLIEKLPINTFRLGLIDTIFPGARYIHIYRNGLDVAKSIEERCLNGRWYGVGEHKLHQLVKYAEMNEETKHVPSICQNYFEKGLMEWRLSVESIVKFLSNIQCSQYIELSYESLIDYPKREVIQILDFLGLVHDSNMLDYAITNVRNRKSLDNKTYCTKKNMIIGGRLLSFFVGADINNGLVRLQKHLH